MMGRIPPLMLVGEGASQFAKEQGLRVVERSDSEEMVSPRARSEWRVWRERWDRCCRRSAAEEEEEEEQPARVSDDSDLLLDPDLRLRGEGQHEDEEASVLLAPRVGCGSDGGADGGHGYGESLRARQDTVGAVVLVGGAADDVHRQQVAAGVSRCVPVVCYQSISSLAVQPHYNIHFHQPRAKNFLILAGPRRVFYSGGLLLKHSGRVGEVSGALFNVRLIHTHIYIYPQLPFWSGDACEPEELKRSGRSFIQAAIFGAGCWAERSAGGCRVACSVSGQGELIVQSLLAKTLAERIAASAANDKDDNADDDDDNDTHNILRSVLVDEFYSASLRFSIMLVGWEEVHSFTPHVSCHGGSRVPHPS